MVDWKKLKKQIPSRIHVKRKVWYEVVWVTPGSMPDCVGQTRPDTRQILIELGHSDKETVHTYLHELAHAVSCEYDLSMTESQVLKFEKAIYYLIKGNNLWKKK